MAVWKRVQRLRELGYPIQSNRGTGYRLTEGAPAPSQLAGRGAGILGGQHRYLGVTSSTQDEARAWAGQGAPAGGLVVAEGQTAGRGRRDRSWRSPPGKGLYCSVVLRDLALTELPLLGFAAGLALAEAAGVGRVRWPNDVVAPDGGKLGGVLVEAQTQAGEAHVVILGLGLNVRSADLPEGGTSLSQYCGATRLDVLEGLIAYLEPWLERLEHQDEVLAAWCRRDTTVGRQVRVLTRLGVVEGLASAVRADGTLVVTKASGEEARITAGDVELLGAPDVA